MPGGFGSRGTGGMVAAAEYARETGTPYFGICYGFQWAVVEFARNVCGLAGANSTEVDPETPHRIIYKLQDLLGVDDMGGTMRLGSYVCKLKPGSRAAAIYAATEVSERHRHRYEFNQAYLETIERHGMVVSGLTPDGKFVEIAELPDHPWFVAVQYHPEFKSTPLRPHPLFKDFVRASLARQRERSARASGRKPRSSAREASLLLETEGLWRALTRKGPLFLIAGPCVIESQTHPAPGGGSAQGHHARARDALDLQGQLRQGQPLEPRTPTADPGSSAASRSWPRCASATACRS